MAPEAPREEGAAGLGLPATDYAGAGPGGGEVHTGKPMVPIQEQHTGGVDTRDTKIPTEQANTVGS